MERSRNRNRGGHVDDDVEDIKDVEDVEDVEQQVQAMSDAELVYFLTEEDDEYDPEMVALMKEEADVRGGLEQLAYLIDEDDDYETPLAGRFQRLLAQFLDWVALGAAVSLGAINSPGMAIGLLVLFVIFQIYLLASQGQTIGKSLLKIKIVRNDDESNPGFWRAVVLRNLISGVLGLIDILFIFGAERRCLHDYIADTKVVDEREV